ncbi:MAG: SUMF1/EgtB/PvdO family nonheme iron enzyme, partial [Anaerolineales bacterium]|nr:SUMF1/EgtB/PvdO family nonheme iron enzyme [Anaerolineales bacterium]
ALAAASDTPLPAPAQALPTATPTPQPTLTATAGEMMISLVTPVDWPAWIVEDHQVPMVYVEAGEFLMGKEDTIVASPVHSVYLDAFYIDQYEVTNARYAECVAAGRCTAPLDKKSLKRADYYGNSRYDDYPVIFVTWQMANEYCQWRGGRLPTEAEWEKAGRGGLDGKTYPWGDEQPVCQEGALNGAKFDDDGACNDADTEPVGSFAPNGYGLYDMAGNVWEWVSDWYSPDYYAASPSENPQGPDQGEERVLRGGSFGSSVTHQGVSYRNYYDPNRRSYAFGVRCVRTPGQLAEISPVATLAPAPGVAAEPAVAPTPGPAALVVVHSANVRYGPGTMYAVLEVVMRDVELEIIGRSQDNIWLVVRIDGDRTGWVAASALSFSASLEDIPVVTPPPLSNQQASGADSGAPPPAGGGDSGGGSGFWGPPK